MRPPAVSHRGRGAREIAARPSPRLRVRLHCPPARSARGTIMRRAFGVFASLCLCGLILGSASAADDASIPPQLRDWQGWVLHGQEQRTCPLLNTQDGSDDNAYQCAWPGRLTLTVDKAGAHFQLAVHVDAESWIDLPGSRDVWPQQVQIGNAPATVLDRNGTPSLRLTAGDYTIRGVFEWDERPARL